MLVIERLPSPVLAHAPSEIFSLLFAPWSRNKSSETRWRPGTSRSHEDGGVQNLGSKMKCTLTFKACISEKKAQRAGAGSSSLVMLLEDETAGGFPMIHAAGHLSPSVFAFCSYLCPIINAYQSFSLFLLCVPAPLSSPISEPQQLRQKTSSWDSLQSFCLLKSFFFLSSPLLQSASSWGNVGPNE